MPWDFPSTNPSVKSYSKRYDHAHFQYCRPQSRICGFFTLSRKMIRPAPGVVCLDPATINCAVPLPFYFRTGSVNGSSNKNTSTCSARYARIPRVTDHQDDSLPSSPNAGTRHVVDMTSGSIPRLLLLFSLPMLATSSLQVVQNVINGIWIGNFLDRDALAASQASFPLLFILMALGGGFALASNILIAQHVGARRYADVRRVVQTSTVAMLLLSLLLMLLGQFFAVPILRLIHTAPEVIDISAHYLRLLLLGLPWGFGLFLFSSNLRGAGDSTTPMRFLAVSVGLTILLDPLFMLGWLGFPRMGLPGTAVASIIAQLVAFVGLAMHMHKHDFLVTPDWRRLRIEPRILWSLVKLGVPPAVQQSVVSVSLLVITGILNGFGKEVPAAFNIAMRIDSVAFLPAMTIGMAVSTLVGQNIGARRYERIPPIFHWGMLLSISISMVISIVAIFAPALLLRVFTHDNELIEIGVGYLRIVGITYVIFSALFISNGVINGAGHTLATTIISIIGLWVIRVPLATYLAGTMQSPRGVWIAMLISVMVATLISLAYYYSGRWKRTELDASVGEKTQADVVLPALDSAAKSD